MLGTKPLTHWPLEDSQPIAVVAADFSHTYFISSETVGFQRCPGHMNLSEVPPHLQFRETMYEKAQWMRKGRALQVKRVNRGRRSTFPDWDLQSAKIEQGFCDIRGWKLLNLRARNPDNNS